ncbi:MAG: T9SS type A sorting domain-containing protein, partial [candidate division WOR-3 bacterium]
SDDQTIRIPLPFVFKYYGQRFAESLSICGNGWIMPGRTTSTAYSNQQLPDPTSTNPHSMICINWDDLYPPYGNRIWYLYEPDSHRFIIEWDSVHYFSPNSQWDKFEIIVYDTTIPTPTGDNRIVFQYYSSNNYVSNTVGIENNTSTRGICGLYNGTYHRAQAPLVSGRAISFETGEPQVGIWEKEVSYRNPIDESFRIYPTILKGNLEIAYLLKHKENKKAILYDAVGKRVKEFLLKPEFRSLALKNLPSGIYFLNLEEKEKDAYKIIILK